MPSPRPRQPRAAKAKRQAWKPHPAKIAQDKWEAESEPLFNPKTLGNVAPRYYLTNRLHSAFQAGWDAAEKQQLRRALREVRG